MGLLSREGDRPAQSEEAAIERIERNRTAHLAEIDRAIDMAQKRQHSYLARGMMEDARIQQGVKDRRLDERRAVMGLIGRHG